MLNSYLENKAFICSIVMHKVHYVQLIIFVNQGPDIFFKSQTLVSGESIFGTLNKQTILLIPL